MTAKKLEEHTPLTDAEKLVVRLLARKYVEYAKAANAMLTDPSAQESNTEVLHLSELSLKLLDDLRAAEIERDIWRKEWNDMRTRLQRAAKEGA